MSNIVTADAPLLRPYRDPGPVSDNVIAIASGKGGVGKTSLATALAAFISERRYSVCLVDLDTQAAVAPSLGIRDRSDDGYGLLAALCDPDGSPLQPIADCSVTYDRWTFNRTGLAVVPGGLRFQDLGAICRSDMSMGDDGLPEVRYSADDLLRLRAALRPIAEAYDHVILDCSPGEAFLQQSALAAARFVITPTKSDAMSVEAVRTVAKRFQDITWLNDRIDFLGIVLFAVTSGGTALRRQTQANISDLVGATTVFENFIRDVPAPADRCRHIGLLPYELEQLYHVNRKEYPKSITGLTQDYEQLAREVLSHRVNLLNETAGVA